MRVVGFYTPGLYEREARRLEASLKGHGLDYQLVRKADLPKSWQERTTYKVTFCKQMLHELGAPLLYLDVDAFCHENPATHPEIIKGTGGFAAHVRADVELISATLLFRDATESRLVLEEWDRVCRREPNRWDQKNLQEAVHHLTRGSRIKFQPLDAGLCWIEGVSSQTYTRDRIWIEQLQASRERFHGSPLYLLRQQRIKLIEDGRKEDALTWNL